MTVQVSNEEGSQIQSRSEGAEVRFGFPLLLRVIRVVPVLSKVPMPPCFRLLKSQWRLKWGTPARVRTVDPSDAA